MKNFLDLPDIKEMPLVLRLAIEPREQPDVVIKVNDILLHSGPVVLPHRYRVELSLTDPLEFSIELRNKDYNRESSALRVQQFSLDHWEFVPDKTQLFEYINDHNYSDPTNYICFNGVWRLAINCSYYRWRHEHTGSGWYLEPEIWRR
jgi:hypothetical protein